MAADSNGSTGLVFSKRSMHDELKKFSEDLIPDDARRLLLIYLARINELADRPEYYYGSAFRRGKKMAIQRLCLNSNVDAAYWLMCKRSILGWLFVSNGRRSPEPRRKQCDDAISSKGAIDRHPQLNR